MKHIIGLLCLALFCLGAAWAEYEIFLQLGSLLMLLAVASLLAALLLALSRAPEGYERADGFHIRGHGRRSGVVREIPLSHLARRTQQM